MLRALSGNYTQPEWLAGVGLVSHACMSPNWLRGAIEPLFKTNWNNGLQAVQQTYFQVLVALAGSFDLAPDAGLSPGFMSVVPNFSSYHWVSLFVS